jgi:uncharacterized ion transporter superfamily protein YfcC
MAEEKKKQQPNKIKEWAFKIAKATVKAVLIYLLYFVVAPYVLLFAAFVPGLAEMIEVFVAVTVVLMILSDLTANTVYECFLNAGRALFTIAFLVFALGNGVFNVAYGGFNVTVNLTAFFLIAALLGLLGLAKSVLQAINFMSERAESGAKP